MTLAGHPGVVELHPEREYTPQAGWQTTRRFKAVREDMEGFLPTLVADGFQISLQHDAGPVYIARARIANAQDGSAAPDDPDTALQVRWELVGNDLEKDIFSHSAFAALDSAKKVSLRNYRQDPVTHPYAPTGGTDEAKFKDLLDTGAESYTLSQWVLRRVAMAPSAWGGQVTLSNVGKRFTSTTQIKTLESIPADLSFVMPDGEWLKRTPTFQQQSDGKYQITTEWWHADAWSDLLYAAAS